jgi:hypothetical protein
VLEVGVDVLDRKALPLSSVGIDNRQLDRLGRFGRRRLQELIEGRRVIEGRFVATGRLGL